MWVLPEPAEWGSRLVAHLLAATRLAALPAEVSAPDRAAFVQIDFSPGFTCFLQLSDHI